MVFVLALLPFYICWYLLGALGVARHYFATSRAHQVAWLCWRASLSFGLGVALSSLMVWLFLIWPHFFSGRVSSLDQALPRVLAAEIVLAIIAFAMSSRRARKLSASKRNEPLQSALTGDEPDIEHSFEYSMSGDKAASSDVSLHRKLMWALFLSAVFSGVVFATATYSRRFGELDAWSIWNLHARFIYRGGAHWPDFFDDALRWSHPDYPLLIPLTVAQGWQIVGSEWNGVPVALGLLFAIATTGFLMSSLWLLRGESQALLAGIVLLGTPFFALNSAAQTADVPLGFYFLASLVCLFLLQQSTDIAQKDIAQKRALVFLSGLLTGAAAWTKNEGSLWLACMTVILVAHLYIVENQVPNPIRKWRAALAVLCIFIVAALPGAIAKITVGFFAPPNDLLGAQGASTIEKLRDFSRWKETLASFVVTSQVFGLWACPSALFMWYYARSSGIKTKVWARQLWPSRVLPLMLCGFFGIFLITPQPLEWHLTNSLNRLFLQLWPSTVFVFVFFLCAYAPKEVTANAHRASSDD